MKRVLHIVLLLAVAAACRGPRVIPRDELTDIYYEMFMADQKIREFGYPSAMIDTMLVYEPIFEKYGYDTDDYLHSMRYYLKDPERFAKVFEEVSKRLSEDAKSLDPVIEHRNWVSKQMGTKRPRLDSILAPFSRDSVQLGQVRFVRDSSLYGAWFRLAPVDGGSLRVPFDPLLLDSLKKDTVAVDSLEKPLEKPVEEPSAVEPIEKPAVKPSPERPPRRARERELKLKEERIVEVAEEEPVGAE